MTMMSMGMYGEPRQTTRQLSVLEPALEHQVATMNTLRRESRRQQLLARGATRRIR
jgi:hypothetical protein